MSETKRYLRVRRITLRDLFWLRRVDAADGARFRPGDVVVACRDCRGVSRRENWLSRGGACPLCGCRDSVLLRGARTLYAGGAPRVIPSHPGTLRGYLIGAGAIALCVALCVLAACLPVRSDKAGFFSADNGRFYYVNEDGTRYTDGTYTVGGQVYAFSDGLLADEAMIQVGNALWLTDADGVSRVGWHAYAGSLVYVGEKGVEKGRVFQAQGAGFYRLDGLGERFVNADGTPANGWVAHEGGMYHFDDGLAAPIDGLAGTFDEKGRLTPHQTGFIRLNGEAHYLYASGQVGSGLTVCDRFVYMLSESGTIMMQLPRDELNGLSLSPSGALIPDEDTLLNVAQGMVLVQADTGVVRTGWCVHAGGVYFAGEDGYLYAGTRSAQPEGLFDTAGRFLPAAEGRVKTGDGICHVKTDGTLVTGWFKEGDTLCLYSDHGILRARENIESVGVTDDNGVFRPYTAGVYSLGDAYYCLSADGAVRTGWQRAGKMYYFDEQTGCRAVVGASTDGAAYALSGDGYFAPQVEGIYTLGENEYYLYTDGTVATGWRSVGGTLTCFDEQTGARTAGEAEAPEPGWLVKNGVKFFVLPDGSLAKGWRVLDNLVYYFDPATGESLSGARQIDGVKRLLREDGVLLPQTPTTLMIDGVSTRIGASGHPEGGFLVSGGHLYHYDEATAALSTRLPASVDGYISTMNGYILPRSEGVLGDGHSRYYLDASGRVLTGWFVRGGQLYFADEQTALLPPDGASDLWPGAFLNGVFTPLKDGAFTPDDQTFLFRLGALLSGWAVDGNRLIYIEADTGRRVVSATRQIDGESCYFDNHGWYWPDQARIVRLADETVLVSQSGILDEDGGVYPLDGRLLAVLPGGFLAESAREAKLDETTLVVREGVIYPVQPGLVFVGDNGYWLSADGTFATGHKLVGGKLRFFSAQTGVMQVGTQLYNEDGEYIATYVGIHYLDGEAYYVLDNEGYIGVGMFPDYAMDMHYADEEGRLKSGFVDFGGERYFFDGPKTQYTMVTSSFINISTDPNVLLMYYADEYGHIVTGLYTVNGVTYCFDETGLMLYDTLYDGMYINLYGEVI